VNLAADKGIPIPLGWAIDKEGKPTTDPLNVGALLPFGGPKASGMALMFECLTSLFVGNPLLARRPDVKPHPGTQNSVLAAVDISLFTDLDAYRDDADNLVDHIKGLPKADGFDEILVPGEIEDRVYAERLENGIPLPDGTIKNLQQGAAEMGVPLPAELR